MLGSLETLTCLETASPRYVLQLYLRRLIARAGALSHDVASQNLEIPHAQYAVRSFITA
jgi:hypothetical protein